MDAYLKKKIPLISGPPSLKSWVCPCGNQPTCPYNRRRTQWGRTTQKHKEQPHNELSSKTKGPLGNDV